MSKDLLSSGIEPFNGLLGLTYTFVINLYILYIHSQPWLRIHITDILITNKCRKATSEQDILVLTLDSLVRTARNCKNTERPQGSAVGQGSGLLVNSHWGPSSVRHPSAVHPETKGVL